MRYLLAAEADKIQEFIFRSSRLREVVGASQLLSRFCRSEDGALALAKQYHGEMVVNDGGSFRVIFDGAEAHQNAIDFGAELSELYRLSLGGSLSVAEPVAMNGDFRLANDKAGKKLRQAKNHKQGSVAEPHMPYIAFCASCGVTLADHFGLLPQEPGTRKRYLCATCRTKAQERWDERLGQLGDFLIAITGSEDQLDRFAWPEDADKVAAHDLSRKNYVAYLVADGNGMGTIFGQCDESQIKNLSNGLTAAARGSLAAASSTLIARLERQNDEDGREIIPVLPLILGGDDLFALLPAPYTLDVVRQFCIEWEKQLARLVKDVGLEIGQGGNKIPRPTVAAAVVICKSKYPYALAHRRAEELLKEAKRHSKLLGAEKGEHLSAVSFEVILGNRLAGEEDEVGEQGKAIQPTLRPYWVTEGEVPPNARERGIDLRQLLAQRLALKDVPNKRLIEVRRQFGHLPTDVKSRNRDESLAKWTAKLDVMLKRSDKRKEVGGQWKNVNPLRDALAALGKATNEDRGAHNWREVKRGEKPPLAHGMLDLLEAWDFAQDLAHGSNDYEPKEEEE
jgi:hypothetical protein